LRNEENEAGGGVGSGERKPPPVEVGGWAAAGAGEGRADGGRAGIGEAGATPQLPSPPEATDRRALVLAAPPQPPQPPSKQLLQSSSSIVTSSRPPPSPSLLAGTEAGQSWPPQPWLACDGDSAAAANAAGASLGGGGDSGGACTGAGVGCRPPPPSLTSLTNRPTITEPPALPPVAALVLSSSSSSSSLSHESSSPRGSVKGTERLSHAGVGFSKSRKSSSPNACAGVVAVGVVSSAVAFAGEAGAGDSRASPALPKASMRASASIFAFHSSPYIPQYKWKAQEAHPSFFLRLTEGPALCSNLQPEIQKETTIQTGLCLRFLLFSLLLF
jgi:hypothetical protein